MVNYTLSFIPGNKEFPPVSSMFMKQCGCISEREWRNGCYKCPPGTGISQKSHFSLRDPTIESPKDSTDFRLHY